MSSSTVCRLAIVALYLSQAAAQDIQAVPIRLQVDNNVIKVDTNLTANSTSDTADGKRISVPGMQVHVQGVSVHNDSAQLVSPRVDPSGQGTSDVRLQLLPEGLTDGSECDGRNCSSAAQALLPVLNNTAQRLNNTWDDLVEKPLHEAKDALVRGLKDAVNRLREGFENAGDSFAQVGQSTGNAFQQIGQSISSAAQAVASGVREAANAVKDFFTGIFG